MNINLHFSVLLPSQLDRSTKSCTRWAKSLFFVDAAVAMIRLVLSTRDTSVEADRVSRFMKCFKHIEAGCRKQTKAWNNGTFP